MGCGCNKKRVTQKTRSHGDVLKKLQKGLCKIDFKPDPDKHTSIYCTLQSSVLPNRESKLHRETNKDSLSNDNILVWALNKNRNKHVDSVAGWVKIELNEIDNYEFLQPIKENK